MTTLTLKMFDACEPRELVRFTDDRGATHWALVGERGNGRLLILVLTLNGAPYAVNIMGPMEILKPEYQSAALSYGTKYTVYIEHSSACEVGPKGTLAKRPGALLLVGNDRFVCCQLLTQPVEIGYHNLKTGQLRTSERGADRTVFACWRMVWIDENDAPTTLFRVCANTTPIVAPIIATAPRGESQFDNR